MVCGRMEYTHITYDCVVSYERVKHTTIRIHTWKTAMLNWFWFGLLFFFYLVFGQRKRLRPPSSEMGDTQYYCLYQLWTDCVIDEMSKIQAPFVVGQKDLLYERKHSLYKKKKTIRKEKQARIKHKSFVSFFKLSQRAEVDGRAFLFE